MKIPAVPFLLLLLALQAAGVAVLFVLRPLQWTPPAAEVPAADSLRPLDLAAEHAVGERYAVQARRPLFVPGRRPVPAETGASAPEPAAKGAEILEKIQLLGVYGSAGEEGGIILRHEGEVRRLGVGKRLEDLTLARVDGMNAVFWDGHKEHILRLKPVERPQSRRPRPAAQGAGAVQPPAEVVEAAPVMAPVQENDAASPAADRAATPPAVRQ